MSDPFPDALNALSNLALLGIQFLVFGWTELTHLKRPRCWERLKAGVEGDNRGRDSWMASPTQWTRVWAISRSWWQTGRPGMLQSMGSQRVGHDWAAELNWDSWRGDDWLIHSGSVALLGLNIPHPFSVFLETAVNPQTLTCLQNIREFC